MGGIVPKRAKKRDAECAKDAKTFGEHATPTLSLGSHVFGKREEHVAIAHTPLATEV